MWQRPTGAFLGGRVVVVMDGMGDGRRRSEPVKTEIGFGVAEAARRR